MARRQLRLKLRRARYEASKTQAEVAEALDWSQSKVLRIENGQSTVATSDVMALLTQYPSLADQTQELIELARESRRPTVASRYEDVMTPQFAQWLEYEAYAARIRQYETTFVPGLLQTDDYATAIVNGALSGDYDEKKKQRIVAARIERSEPLVSAGGPRMDFIVDEAALRRAVGNESGTQGYTAMIEQLRYLQKMNTYGRAARGEAIEPDLNPHISIQIMPLESGVYTAMRGPFELVEFENDEDEAMMYFENPDGDVVIRDNSFEPVTKYLDMFAEMKRRVPPAAETNAQIDLIITLMEERRNGIPAPAPARRTREAIPA